MGHLIPAGTGLKKYKNIILTEEEIAVQEEKAKAEEVIAEEKETV